MHCRCSRLLCRRKCKNQINYNSELRPYEISVDAERVLEVVWEEAEANVGDLVDDWLDSRTAYTTEQLADLSERLTGVIKTWLEETHNEPDFFNIIGEKEISICNISQ